MSLRRAAVDVGTNSVRLLVVDPSGRPLARRMTITRLGEGIDATGHLDDRALQRTLAQLAHYRREWEHHGVEPAGVRVAATSAVRDAADRHRFFDGVRQATGVDAEMLSGEQEARLTFVGALAATAGRRRPDDGHGGVTHIPETAITHPVTLIDVGGGSTEVVVGDGTGGPRAAVSCQIGSVRVTEQELTDDPPSNDQLAGAKQRAERLLATGLDQLAEDGADPAGCATLLGVAGTVTTLAALHLGLDRYEPDTVHLTRLSRRTVDRLVGWLASMTVAERAQLGPVPPGRADVIVGGAVVVAAALDLLAVDELVVSEADILHGLVREGLRQSDGARG